MMLRLNPQLDLDACRTNFAKDDRLRLENALIPDDAQALAQLAAAQSFAQTLSDGSGTARVTAEDVQAMSPSHKAELRERLANAASRGEGFHYESVRLDGDGPPALAPFVSFLGSDTVLEFIRAVTGEPVTGADAQATRYRHGHYLTRHRDQVAGENRRIAYVLGLSQQWHPDWGGLLQFFEEGGAPRDAWLPAFNTLSLFHTRHIHAVTYVTPFARAPRLSITGWFYA